MLGPFDRAELDAMVAKWVQANHDAEASGDWRSLAECYAVDATYGWTYGPDIEFMVVGREQIRDIALGLEMGGLSGWVYPHQATVIDERQGMVVIFYRQIADAVRRDGTPYEVAGISGSWFGYGGNMQWAWQRDWFDYGNATAVFIEMMNDGTLPETMASRMNRPPRPGLPGHYRRGEAPVSLWSIVGEPG